MTGPEVTAAMKAEDVDAALVEKAARAMWSIPPQDPDSALAWPSWDVAVERADAGLWDLPQMVADTRNLARHALAAVLPEIVAKAYRDAAGETERYAEETYWRDDSPFHAQGRFHAGEHATRLRNGAEGWSAARLTDTNGEPTT